MTAHTPGPWQFEADPYTITPWQRVYFEHPIGSLEETICNVNGNGPAIANARLIAAAPALLDALQAIVEAARMSDQPRALYCAEIARAAIAQATGEES